MAALEPWETERMGAIVHEFAVRKSGESNFFLQSCKRGMRRCTFGATTCTGECGSYGIKLSATVWRFLAS